MPATQWLKDRFFFTVGIVVVAFFTVGIVNRVVPHEQLREVTLELANKIANGPWNAIQMARMIVNSAEHDTLRESLDKAYLAAHPERETMAKDFIAKGEKKQANFSNT